MSTFKFAPSHHVPFRDVAAIERCRNIKRSEIEKHANPDFRIKVVKDADVEFLWVTDMVHRLAVAAQAGKPIVMILPNPCPTYRHVARLINALKIDCRKLTAVAMDEYADQDGKIAPETWSEGFGYAMKHNLLYQIDPALRPPESNFIVFRDSNLKDYAKLIEDAGGADICYSGPGWTGHLAFIEPDAPEFKLPLEEWKKAGPRIVTLSPYTLAQNSLHGSFGLSGDLASVPPRAATIGPEQVVNARARFEVAAITVHGTTTAWQRMAARLCYHGPVTPQLPTSILQLLRTDVYVSETIAMDIKPDENKGY